MKIVVANCRGISNVRARHHFFGKLQELQADIYMLTETKLLSEDITSIRMAWGKYQDQINTFIDCDDEAIGRSGGVAVLFELGLDFKVNQVKKLEVGTHLILDITVQANRYKLITFYGDPSASDEASKRRLLKMHTEMKNMTIDSEHATIMGGDFNFVANIKDSTRSLFKTQTPFL